VESLFLYVKRKEAQKERNELPPIN
jgi:hypothetical protein